MRLTITLEVHRHPDPPAPAPVEAKPSAPQVDVKHASSLERPAQQRIGFEVAQPVVHPWADAR